jgi:hypothetical protein
MTFFRFVDKRQQTSILVSMIYFDSDMFKSTNTVVYLDWKTVIYIYACGKSRTGVQHYVLKFVSDLRQVGGFLRTPRFPPPIKLTVTI